MDENKDIKTEEQLPDEDLEDIAGGGKYDWVCPKCGTLNASIVYAQAKCRNCRAYRFPGDY
ncbi:MAG: hypothetical protein Q4B67_02030 [Eubacteriales bacterium]|nr:hypothetical protein [Eubacteriales bacterium]